MGDNKIETYVELFNHLLRSYATNANIAMEKLEICQLVKPTNEEAVQFADAVLLKKVSLSSAYLDERIKEVFIDDVSLTSRSGVCMFWGRESEAHLTGFAQYVNQLLVQ